MNTLGYNQHDAIVQAVGEVMRSGREKRQVHLSLGSPGVPVFQFDSQPLHTGSEHRIHFKKQLKAVARIDLVEPCQLAVSIMASSESSKGPGVLVQVCAPYPSPTPAHTHMYTGENAHAQYPRTAPPPPPLALVPQVRCQRACCAKPILPLTPDAGFSPRRTVTVRGKHVQVFEMATAAAALEAYQQLFAHWMTHDMWWINMGTKDGDESGIPDE